MRVFLYCNATSEVNMFLAQKHFVWDHIEKQTLLEISHGLAWDLIHNPYCVVSLVQPKSSKCSRKTVVMYEKATCPTFTSHWKGTKFITDASHKYNQFTCRSHGCKKWVQTYRVCNPGSWMCEDYWCSHFLEHAVAYSLLGTCCKL